MVCKDYQSLIHDRVDGTIVAAQNTRLERHLSQCSSCAQTVERFCALEQRLDRLPVEPVPAGFSDRVMDGLRGAGLIREPVLGPRPVGFFGGMAKRLTAPAVALLVVVLAVAIFPAGVGTLKGMAGTGTVLVTETYLTVRDAVGSVGILTSFFGALGDIARTARIVLGASFSLLASIGGALMLPALGVLLMLAIGGTWFVRNRRRGAVEHATFSY